MLCGGVETLFHARLSLLDICEIGAGEIGIDRPAAAGPMEWQVSSQSNRPRRREQERALPKTMLA
jgi:hypothetical protein